MKTKVNSRISPQIKSSAPIDKQEVFYYYQDQQTQGEDITSVKTATRVSLAEESRFVA